MSFDDDSSVFGGLKTIMEGNIEPKEKSIDMIRRPILSYTDNAKIKKKLKECKGNIKKVLLDQEVANEGIILPLVSCTLYILLMIYITRIDVINQCFNLVTSVYENEPWGEAPQKRMADIQTLDNLSNYISEILLVSSYSTERLQTFNYVAGLRFSLKLANLIPNPVYDAPAYITEESDYSASYYNSGENINRQATWQYTSKSFQGAGGYTQYFINTTLEEALAVWRGMRPIWLDKSTFIALAVEMIVENSNLYATIYYYQLYQMDTSGTMMIETGTYGINPDVYSAQSGTFIGIIVVLVLYLMIFLGQFCQAIKKLYKGLTDCLKCKNRWTWYDYLEIILVALTTTIIVMFGITDVGNANSFTLPITDSNIFDAFIDHALNFKILSRIASCTCLMSVIRLVALLKIKFPSFGVLFETIKLSKNDIINFGVMGILMYIGFVLSSMLGMGVHDAEFSSFSNASTRIFGNLVGIIGLDRFDQENLSYRSFFILVFTVLYNFILIKMFWAIVMSTFITLKERNELLIAAMAENLKKETLHLGVLIMNLIFFVSPDNLNAEVTEYTKIRNMLCSGKEGEEDRDILIEKLKNLENSIKKLSNRNFIATFKENLASITSALHTSSLQNIDAVVKDLKNCIRAILEKQRIDEIKRENLEVDVDYNFALIVGLALHILFLILYTYSLGSELYIRPSYNLQELSRTIVYLPTFSSVSGFSLINVTTFDNIYNFIDEVLLKLLLGIPFYNNILYLDNSIRITIQLNSFVPNKSEFSKNLFPLVVSSGVNSTRFRGPSTELMYDYEVPGAGTSFFNEGGFAFTFQDYNHAREILQAMNADLFFTEICQYMALEWVLYNSNNDAFVYNYLLFTQANSGYIYQDFYSKTIGPEFHSSSGDTKFTVLLVLAIIISLYFVSIIIKEFFAKWKKANLIRLQDLRNYDRLQSIIISICETDIVKPTSCMEATLHGLSYCCKVVYQYILQFLLVFLKYFVRKPSALIEAISLCLVYFTIFQMILYKYKPFALDDIDGFSSAANNLDRFASIAATSLLFLFFRTIKYLFLSSNVLFMASVIRKAWLDILFFLLMFGMILFGFGVTGYIMLGQSFANYRDISHSVLSCYFMIFKVYDYKQYSKADNALGIPYIILYMVVMCFFLYPVFIAILTGYYNSLSHKNISKIGFIEKIIKTLNYKLKGKKVLDNQPTEVENVGDSTAQALDNFYNEPTKNSQRFDEDSAHHANRWLQCIEKTLATRSSNTFSFPMLKMKELTIEKQYCVDFKYIAFLNKDQWDNESWEEKVKIWNTLSYKYKEQLVEKEQAQMLMYDQSQNLPHTALQATIWDSSEQIDRLRLWTGELCFEARAGIWDTVPYPDHLKLKWNDYSSRDKIRVTQAIINPVRKHTEAVRRLANVVPYILSLDLSEKMKLWLVIYWSEKVKMGLYINSSDPIESEMLGYLMMCEAYNDCLRCESYDNIFSEFLDHSIYSSIECDSWLKVEFDHRAKLIENIEKEDSEIRSLLKYKGNLLTKIKSFNQKRKNLYE